MKTSTTFEKITLDMKGATFLPNGMMKVPATLTRAGVFPYMKPDGSRRLELRTPEEVFAEDSVSTFENVPLTNDHPYAEGGAVTAENARRVTVGTISNVHRSGMSLDAIVTVYDADTIADVKNGKIALSCGYFNEREEKSGIYLDEKGNSQSYTHVQHAIRGNHVALVQVGRAGPEARLRLDSTNDCSFLVTDEIDNKTEKEVIMKTITLDSLPAEMPEASAAIVTKAIGDRDAKIIAHEASIRSHETSLKDAQAKLDKQQATLDSLQGDLKAATDPAKFQAAVAARVSLEAGARKILGESTDLSKMNERQVKVAVVAKLAPAINCDSKSDDYVNAAFELQTANVAGKNVATEVVTQQMQNGQAKTVTTVVTDGADETPFQKMMREQTNSQPTWPPKK